MQFLLCIAMQFLFVWLELNESIFKFLKFLNWVIEVKSYFCNFKLSGYVYKPKGILKINK